HGSRRREQGSPHWCYSRSSKTRPPSSFGAIDRPPSVSATSIPAASAPFRAPSSDRTRRTKCLTASEELVTSRIAGPPPTDHESSAARASGSRSRLQRSTLRSRSRVPTTSSATSITLSAPPLLASSSSFNCLRRAATSKWYLQTKVPSVTSKPTFVQKG